MSVYVPSILLFLFYFFFLHSSLSFLVYVNLISFASLRLFAFCVESVSKAWPSFAAEKLKRHKREVVLHEGYKRESMVFKVNGDCVQGFI